MNRIRLIHWNANEAAERVEQLRAAGCQVDFAVLKGGGDLRDLATNPPDAVTIDLHRLPSAGRDMGLFLRKQKSTRRLPLVFAGGDLAKVARIKELLPDATYTSWSRIRESLDHAIRNPLADPVVPDSALAGYSGTPLPKKLGIKENMAVALIDAPDDFETTLGDVPIGVVFHRRQRGQSPAGCALVIWFNRSRQDVDAGIRRMARDLPKNGRVWIAWPKKASGVVTDLAQPYVRKTGLAAGLVDYKICAIDKTWSGLLFTRRKT
ncbi:MAG: hypothetical protein OXQ89_14255 [Rhodospirillaceae bacterium]|nr:hypothetical protein [Rhodospirillaceae bacterium]MDD9998900.1 hypothetical protein [Rhodospirillaceae bacterium]